MARDVFIHPGTPRPGFFCPDCCTPTVIVVPYFWITSDGVTTAPSNTVCTACRKHFTAMKGGTNGPH